MTRKSAREYAVGIVYCFDYGARPRELLDERLSGEFFTRVSGEDALFDALFEDPPDDKQKEYIARLVTGVYEHLVELDGYIEKYASGWKFNRLPRMALAVMRVCMYEVLYMQDIPSGASMNEAVEISKHYEPADVTAFINGILGSFSRSEVSDG